MLAVLAPLPIGLIVAMLWARSDVAEEYGGVRGERRVWAEVRESLGSGYRTEVRVFRMFLGSTLAHIFFFSQRHWWIGVSLIRRQLVVLAFALTTSAVWRSIALGVLAVVFLLMNLAAKPFANKRAQHLESVSLFLLSALAVTSAPGLSQVPRKRTTSNTIETHSKTYRSSSSRQPQSQTRRRWSGCKV
jgi:hypothetical protein